jgi:transglutaminase-like putative cysteine protease
MVWPLPQPDDPEPLELDKLEKFRKQAHDDATDPRIMAMAGRLARPHKPDEWRAIAREIFNFVRDGIRFQDDPNREQWMVPAPATLEQGWGNCVGKTILAVAMMRALGIEAEIWPVWTGNVMSHVAVRLRFPGVRRQPDVSPDGWLYGELTIRRSDLGQDPFTVPRNPETGGLPLSGG